MSVEYKTLIKNIRKAFELHKRSVGEVNKRNSQKY